MKLLIITQKVDLNDSVLGFFHGWIAEFAKHCEQVTVVCLYKGEYDLPDNVKILSLGKEKISQKFIKSKVHKVILKLKYIFRFYKFIFQQRASYDAVFVHMNQIYVILGWPFWKIWGKKIGLWYTHKAISTSLRIAENLSDVIFTASSSSFRIKSEKVKVMGHGIDVQRFKDSKIQRFKDYGIVNIITIGRISPVKDYDTLINAVEILVKKGKKFKVEIIGGPGTPEQEDYFEKLKKTVGDKRLESVVKFTGPVPNKDIARYLQSADIFINMSLTGSLDKAVLEAMASEVLVLTCNEAIINDVLSEYRDGLFFEKSNQVMLSEKISDMMEMAQEEKEKLGKELSAIVAKDHNLKSLIEKIINILK